MRADRKLPVFSVVLAAAAFAAGCGIVNALDDVEQPHETTYTAGPKVDEPLSDGGSSADGGDTGAPGDHAVMVVAGNVLVDEAGEQFDPVLTVLDTATGHEVGSREKMRAAGVVYDAPRDLWYLFESPSDFVPGPSDVVRLHVRKLDSKTGAWTELSSTVVATPLYYDAIVATNSRLTFIAHPADADAGGSLRMVTLDTSNPASPGVLDERDVAAAPLGMIATRSGSGPGGQVTLLNVGSAADGDCADAGPGACAAKLHRFLIPNGGAPQDLGSFIYGAMSSFGLPGYGSVICGGGPDELLVLPKGGAGPHDVHLLGYQSTGGTLATSYAMATNATRLRRAAVDNVRRLVFLVETNTDTNVHVVSLAPGGATTKAALRHSGQAVYYDHGSQTVFAPFNQGDGYTFSAFRVSGTSTAPQLKERTAAGDWDPPADLRPVLLGIKDPATFACP